MQLRLSCLSKPQLKSLLAALSSPGVVVKAASSSAVDNVARSLDLFDAGQAEHEDQPEQPEEQVETEQECTARMAAVGRQGPSLMVLLRDFALDLKPQVGMQIYHRISRPGMLSRCVDCQGQSNAAP